MNNETIVRLDTKSGAVLLRKILKARFPGVKFSVRTSYFSMGSSITVKYEDGPSEYSVTQVARPFQGHGFDGMTDSTYAKDHTITWGGTTYSPPWAFVTVSRTFSTSVREKLLADYTDDAHTVAYAADILADGTAHIPEVAAGLVTVDDIKTHGFRAIEWAYADAQKSKNVAE